MKAQSAGAVAAKTQQDQETRSRTQHAPRYRVLIHNDDVTPMEFVVSTLRSVFHKRMTEAVTIMLRAHTTGIAHVDTLPLEQAEFRVDQAHSLARVQKLPLKLTYEPEE